MLTPSSAMSKSSAPLSAATCNTWVGATNRKRASGSTKRWISEQRFLHARNYCVLLSGPEAQLDALHQLFPFARSRIPRDLLRQEGVEVGRLYVATLMKRMGTGGTVPPAEHGEAGTRAQGLSLSAAQPGGDAAQPEPAPAKAGVWATDIPYVPMARGFVYLVVIVERLWRSVKYEKVYLNAYASVPEAGAGIGRYIGFYNAVRPHSALRGRTPDQIYFGQPLLAAA